MQYRAALTAIAVTALLALSLVLLAVTGAHVFGWAAVALLFAALIATRVSGLGVRLPASCDRAAPIRFRHRQNPEAPDDLGNRREEP